MPPIHVVLLTATIRPPADVPELARSDVGLRLQDYREAFEFYIDQLVCGVIDGLVLCDNSNHNLDPFRRMADAKGVSARVELLAFNGLDHSSKKGRGYGEFKLVDHAMSHSVLLANPSATVWKITGRYRLLNLRQVLASKPSSATLYCNSRNIPSRWTDLYVLAWNLAGYESLVRNVYLRLGEDGPVVHAEESFRLWLAERAATRGLIQRFRCVPKLAGRRGFDNAEYGEMKLKHLVRVIANRVVPWLWI